MKNEQGKLYVVATPIGNLGDITLRALEILKNADAVACEDTRQTIKLLNHYEISKKMISYHEYSDIAKAEKITDDILSGMNIALVSDAGTPAVSDPGRMLVKKAREKNIEVVGLPGPCAGINAFSTGGFEEKRFVFFGFLSDKAGERKSELESIAQCGLPCILYVSPHKAVKTLQAIKENCGQTEISVFREMTKIHEEFFRGTPDELLSRFAENEPRGEFVFVVRCMQDDSFSYTEEQLSSLMKELINSGLSRKDAARRLSEKTGEPKNRLYNLV